MAEPASGARTVLVVGGTGGFGARLVEGLLATTDLALVVGARNAARTKAEVARLAALHPGRSIRAAALDAATVSADDLCRLGIWCVADMAGPFQGAPPRLAAAAIAAGCHYVDIADARDFVGGIGRLDAAARAAGVLVASGASSTPALSQAVLDCLVAAWRRVDRVEIVIAPGNRQPRGLSVVRAILTRAGQPTAVFAGGAWRTVAGWGMLRRKRLPGLGKRWLSVVETPDLDLLPARFAPRDEALFRASLELSVMHLGLWALSRLVAWKMLRSISALARPLQWAAERLEGFGTDRGGMTVSAEGIDETGTPALADWVLVASRGDGPNIPILPALAIIRALATGVLTRTGATACVDLLPLPAFTAEFQRFHIVTRTLRRPRALFARALPGFAGVPAAIRAGHTVDGDLILEGRASIAGATTAAGRWMARLFRLPPAAHDVPVQVTMTADGDGEIWTRRFGARRFHSRLSAGGRRGLLCERFGPLTFLLAVAAHEQGIDMRIVGGRCGALALPRALLPRSSATERLDAAGRFAFDVPIALPVIGRLVHYRGWLVPRTGAIAAPSHQERRRPPS